VSVLLSVWIAARAVQGDLVTPAPVLPVGWQVASRIGEAMAAVFN